MILERTAGLQILSDDNQTYYRISYTDKSKHVSWFRREYSILYPVDTEALYDTLTQKYFMRFLND